MATALARRTPPRISAPSRTRIVRVTSAIARRGAGSAARAALSEKHTIAAVGTAAVFGYMSRPGSTALPHIAALGQAGTFGAALWLGGRMTKSRTMSHMATGLLAIQAYEWTKQPGGLLSTGTPAGGAAAAAAGMRGIL